MTYITQLRLTDFRSYVTLDIELDGRPVVLFGPNGAGKTNLIEAVSMLSPGRGLRKAKLGLLARQEGDSLAEIWAVAAKVMGEEDAVVQIGVGQVPGAPGRRTMRIDGAPASGSDLARQLTLMWLTPAQDRLFTGPAAERRQFLDRFCLTHAPDHGKAHLRYEKARSERGRLLTEGSYDDLWFDALEADMASFGAHIAQARAITVAELRADITARPDGAFPKSILHLDGEAEAMFESGADFNDVEHFISTGLKQDRSIDRRAGRTLRGVHRSDLQVTHAGKHIAAALCSTGEQKALLIGLILAQARAQSARRPILLLDEVAAHLDEVRRAALIEELLALGTQVFMTGTDASLFDAFNGRAQVFKVKDGQLSAIPN